MDEEFISQEDWDEGYAQFAPSAAPPGDPLRRWLERWIPHRGAGAKCLELGCFPGRYLCVLGELGYELNGVDLTPKVESELPAWLRACGHKIGRFARADAFKENGPSDYDVVYSLGLIEHFANWAELLDVHARLVAPGGLLVVATPNFRGFVQRWLHSWLDESNFLQHNLGAMVPHLWAQRARSQGFEILFQGYCGRFDFWYRGDPAQPLLRRGVARAVRRSAPFLRYLPENVRAYAPFCGLVARRSNAAN